jgi:hypothetical protein
VVSTLPTASATSPASNGTEVSYMGTSFTIPLGLASGTQNEIVPQTSPDEPLQVWPAHAKIVLQGYPLQNTPYTPQVLVFPQEEYVRMSNDPAASQYDANTMVNTLQDIFRTQTFPTQGNLPTLPDPHARQVFHAQETILSFKNGNGIRYLTSYSQAAFPSISGNLLYTFQGLTNDGKYYISVVMPIELAGLDPAPENADQYPNYLSTTVDRLRQPGNPFNPSIESLDALVQSLTVGLPATSEISPASNSADVSYMGTSFTIPTGLANGTQNEIVPRAASSDPNQASLNVWPEHTKIVLQGYPLQGKMYEPQIQVFPADEYQKMSADPETSMYDARSMITTLQYIIATDNFPSQDADTLPTMHPLPTLPDWHAQQIFHAQETILTFKNGNGIRYITSYSQAAFPDISSNLMYSFQGITLDGKYYVSVMMPIELAGLESAPANADQYPNYLNTTVDRLRQAGNPFNPSIESLDALVESLMVGLPATADMAPSTAEPTASAQVDGLWATNVGMLILRQNGPEVTGTTNSYGDLGRQDTLQGTLNGDTITMNSQMLGDLSLIFSGNIFKTADGNRASFCGIRASESHELPEGCGFSGKWILAPDSFFPGGSIMVLKQVDGNVTGDFFDGKGNTFDKLTGQVTWGKGWWLGGKNEKGHTITLMMNSFETGFEYIYDDLYQLKLCAVRDGLNSADLGNLICTP